MRPVLRRVWSCNRSSPLTAFAHRAWLVVALSGVCSKEKEDLKKLVLQTLERREREQHERGGADEVCVCVCVCVVWLV